MEEVADPKEKGCSDDGALQLLYELCEKPSANPEGPIWVDVKKRCPWPVLLQPFIQKMVWLQEHGILTFNPYKTDYRTDPNKLEVHLLPKGLQLVKTRTETVTTTTTETVQLQESESELEPEKKRQFMRTERGFTIMNETNLSDLVNFHINRRIEPGATKSDRKSARIWLDYIIRWRRKDLEQSPALLEKAIYYRDLPINEPARRVRK